MDRIRTIGKREARRLCEADRNRSRVSPKPSLDNTQTARGWNDESWFVIVDEDGEYLDLDDPNSVSLRPCGCAYVLPVVLDEDSYDADIGYDESICYRSCSQPIEKIYHPFAGGLGLPGDIIRGGQNQQSNRLETTNSARLSVCAVFYEADEQFEVQNGGSGTGVFIEINNAQGTLADFENGVEYSLLWEPSAPSIDTHCDDCGSWKPTGGGGPGGQDAVCCECELGTLYVCDLPQGICWKRKSPSFIDSAVGTIRHTVIFTCKDTKETLEVPLEPLSCSGEQCGTPIEVAAIGSCAAFTLEYGNNVDCCETNPGDEQCICSIDSVESLSFSGLAGGAFVLGHPNPAATGELCIDGVNSYFIEFTATPTQLVGGQTNFFQFTLGERMIRTRGVSYLCGPVSLPATSIFGSILNPNPTTLSGRIELDVVRELVNGTCQQTETYRTFINGSLKQTDVLIRQLNCNFLAQANNVVFGVGSSASQPWQVEFTAGQL